MLTTFINVLSAQTANVAQASWPSSISGENGFLNLGKTIKNEPGFPVTGSDLKKARYVFSRLPEIVSTYGLKAGSGYPLSNIVIGLSRLYSWAFPDPENADALKGYFGWGNCGEWSYAFSEMLAGAGVLNRVAYGDKSEGTVKDKGHILNIKYSKPKFNI
jgi:hypothetical protein